MKKTTLLLAIFSFILLTSCSDSKEVTVTELASALNINVFILKLPNDLKEDEVLVLELVGENGVVNSRNIGESYDGYEYLKIFMDSSDSFNPVFSFVTNRTSTVGHVFNTGEAEVKGWTGVLSNADSNTLQIGEFFAFCSVDGTVSLSQNPRDDDFGIRINVKGR